MNGNRTLGGLWYLFKNKNIEIYSISRNSLYYIYISGKDYDSTKETLWLNDGFIKLYPIWIDDSENDPVCYFLLENYLGDTILMDLISKKVVLDRFNYFDYRGYHPILNSDAGFKNRIIDTNIGIIDEMNNFFYLYSIKKGNIVGPCKYSDIEQFQYGFIIDKKTLINYNGEKINFSGYKKEFISKQGVLFYNEENMKCLLFRGHSLNDCVELSQSEKDFYIFEAFSDNVHLKYDMRKKELVCDDKHNGCDDQDNDVEWTSADSYYAFEGHSELELGID